MKCSGKWKIALFMGAVYAALLTVLLTGISYAKYQEERMAYANFGAASFNAVILSADNTVDDMVKEPANKFDVFEVFEEPLKMQISDYRPGMKYDGENPTRDTSKKIDFAIANGVNAENASEANIQYQIALRTTGHLPLKYSLLHKGTGQKLYFAGTDKAKIAPEKDIGTVWYEQRFYETVEGGQREITFDMMGGKLALEEYSLVVEWPIETVGGVRTDDVRYMKEVELLQIFVAVSSKNMLEEPNYGNGVTIKPEYGDGVVILDSEQGNKFVHYIDYRAFRKEEGETVTSYTLTIENGKDKQVRQRTTNTGYSVEIEVPWLAETDKTTATNTFNYQMQTAEGTSIALTSAGYRLYDELYNSAGYNTYTSLTSFTDDQLKAWSAVDSDKRLYKVFTFSGDTMLNTAYTAHEYRLILSGNGSANISDKTSFEHKIKVLVTAEYTGTPIMTEGGESDG